MVTLSFNYCHLAGWKKKKCSHEWYIGLQNKVFFWFFIANYLITEIFVMDQNFLNLIFTLKQDWQKFSAFYPLFALFSVLLRQFVVILNLYFFFFLVCKPLQTMQKPQQKQKQTSHHSELFNSLDLIRKWAIFLSKPSIPSVFVIFRYLQKVKQI